MPLMVSTEEKKDAAEIAYTAIHVRRVALTTVEQVQLARSEVEGAILELLKAFEKNTGIAVNELFINQRDDKPVELDIRL